MRRSLLALSLLPLLSFAPACDTGDDDATSDEAFRAGTDVNMQLTESGGGDEGTVIWDIQEAGVYAGDASEGNQIMELVGNDIYANGQLTCTVENAYLNGRIVMGAGTDEILFTVYENEVYLGELDVNKLTPSTKRRHADQLLLTFGGSDVYWGNYASQFLSANADLESASDGRKLLIAALVEGHCGSKGLP